MKIINNQQQSTTNNNQQPNTLDKKSPESETRSPTRTHRKEGSELSRITNEEIGALREYYCPRRDSEPYTSQTSNAWKEGIEAYARYKAMESLGVTLKPTESRYLEQTDYSIAVGNVVVTEQELALAKLAVEKELASSDKI
jgi:hypothetical protein